MRYARSAVVLALCLLLAALPATARAQPDPVSAWLTLLNSTRLRAGAPPCELSAGLTAAAQRHANDLAANMVLSSTGSDGSTPSQRITDAGFFAWTDENEQPIVGEAVGSGAGTIDEVLVSMLQEQAYSEVILSRLYREVGIGVAADVTGRSYYVLDFGARPNVLPIFLNDGAYNTLDPQVAIHLTNEEVRPEGQGVAIGRVIELRISNEPQWDDLPWQTWEEFVPWMLPEAEGQHTVFVQLRDATGRIVSAADAIYLGEAVAPTLAPVVLTPVSTPAGAATPVPAEGASVQTPVATGPPAAASPAPATSLVTTPFPTWTPLPTPAPPPPVERARLPLGLVAALQGVALILGLYLVLRRGPAQPGGDAPDGEAR
jgi:hypothetical protein